MKSKKIGEIILPYKEGVPLHPSVTMSDKIIHAIELMVNNNLKNISVVVNERPIGMVCLEDALKKLGLQMHREMWIADEIDAIFSGLYGMFGLD